MVPIAYEEISPTTSAALPLTLATINALVAAHGGGDLSFMVSCYTYPVAYRYDGGIPTSSTVQQLAVGDSTMIDSIAAMRNFQAIGIGGTAHLAINYWAKA